MASAKRSLLVWELWPQCGDGFRFGVYSKQSRPQLERRPQSEPDVGSRRKNRVLQETWGAGWREASGGPLPAPQTEPPFRGLEGSGGVSRAPERKTRKLKKTWWDGVRTETTEREKITRVRLSTLFTGLWGEVSNAWCGDSLTHVWTTTRQTEDDPQLHHSQLLAASC